MIQRTKQQLEKSLRKQLKKFEDVKQSLEIEENPASRKALKQKYATLRTNIIHLNRELGIPEYGLEAERNRERLAAESAAELKKKPMRERAGNWTQGVNELPRNKNGRVKVDPDGYYYLLIGRGYSPKEALKRVAERYGQN